MRDDVSLERRLSLAGRIHKMIPANLVVMMPADVVALTMLDHQDSYGITLIIEDYFKTFFHDW